MDIDHVLLGSEAAPLPSTLGYDWIEAVDAIDEFNLGTTAQAAMLLALQVQRNANLFVEGGVIADFDGLVESALTASRFSNPDDAFALDREVVELLATVVPGMAKLDMRSDVGLLLSTYGRICERLPEYDRVRLVEADVHGGVIAALGTHPKPSLSQKIRGLFAKEAPSDGFRLTSDDVAAAACDVVERYCEMMNDGRLEMSPRRAMAVKWAMHSIKSAIESEFPRGWEPYDEPSLIAIDKTMERFESVLDGGLDTSVDCADLIDEEISHHDVRSSSPGMSA